MSGNGEAPNTKPDGKLAYHSEQKPAVDGLINGSSAVTGSSLTEGRRLTIERLGPGINRALTGSGNASTRFTNQFHRYFEPYFIKGDGFKI